MELLNQLMLKKIPNTYSEVILDLPIKKELIEHKEVTNDEDINYDEDDENIDTTRFLKGVKRVIIEKDDNIDEEEKSREEKNDDDNVEDEIINYVEELEEEGEKEITSLASNLGKLFGVKSKEPLGDENNVNDLTLDNDESRIMVDNYTISNIDDDSMVGKVDRNDDDRIEKVKYVSKNIVKPSRVVENIEKIEQSIIEKLPIDNVLPEKEPNKKYMNNRALFIDFINSLWEKKKYFTMDDKKTKKTEDKELAARIAQDHVQTWVRS